MSNSTQNSFQIVTGSPPETLRQQPPLAAFSEQALSLLHALSENLLKRPEYKPHPNLTALGFWLRPASLQKMANEFSSVPPGHQQYPAGLAFHLTPANVDNLFVYSWAISLLCGNNNIIRLSSKESEERQQLLTLLNELLRETRHSDIFKRTAIVSYGHADETTIALSAMASRRILWGSNETIAHLRSLPIPPLCQDIVFPDRRSVALFSAAAVLQTETLDDFLEAFYRDTYGFNQIACSSPRLVLWLKDDDITKARERFWNAFAKCVSKKMPQVTPAVLMDKQVAMQTMAMTADLKIRAMPDARLQVIELDNPNPQIEAEHPGGGLLLDGAVDELTSIHEWLQGQHQTVTYWGVDASNLNQVVSNSTIPLADRIVPAGQALNFSPVWDGMYLFERLSRLVQLA